MIRRLFLTFMIFFLLCCNGNLPQNVEVSTSPVPTPTLTKFEKAKKAKQIEKNKEEAKKFIGEESSFYGLSKLSEKHFPNSDLEIRLWRFAAFGDRNLVFVLTRTNEVWSAKIVQRMIDQKIVLSNTSNKLQYAKYFQRKLENPKADWENFWQKLVDEKILTLPDGIEVGIEPFPDSWEFVVETKVDNNYRNYSYLSPEVFEEIKEAQQMVKIINLVSDEFNLYDFDSNNFMLP
jgi:hypothetical protein